MFPFKASEKYIRTVRDAIGNEHFVNLLNLYQGSALSIIIDTTGSMVDEIATVKETAKLIVERSHPQQYIFVPFADPGKALYPGYETPNCTLSS